MFKKIIFLFLPLFCLLSHGLRSEENNYVLVSVAPHRFFIKKIAGDTLKVGLVVPAGASAHTYEPTPKQMVQASQARLWFRIGEPFERKAIQALQNYNKRLEIVDLRQGLSLIGGTCHHAHHSSPCYHGDSMDLHFWLSPRLAKTQASTIANALIQVYPEHRELYTSNLKKFHEELDQLDNEIQTILEPMPNCSILVSHPAYAYFCRDYGLTQYSIEFEGKDPTPQQLNKTLQLAKELRIKTIYIQMQYPSKGARLIADQIGACLVILDPYSENYIQSLLDIAHAFAKGS